MLMSNELSKSLIPSPKFIAMRKFDFAALMSQHHRPLKVSLLRSSRYIYLMDT